MNSLERDIESRNRIVSDINTNFFVEAGAGSGKTTMLVNRMVAMVESGIDISKISAITFTKAAAGEFYDRFQKLLIERSNPDFKWEDKGVVGQLPKPTEDSRERCGVALQNIDLCFMGTIDSFCNMILTEHPSEAGILSDSNLVTDADMELIFRKLYIRICNGEFEEELMSLSNSFRAVHYQDEEAFCKGMQFLMEHRNVHFNYDQEAMCDIDKDFADVRKELIKTTKCLYENQDIAYTDNQKSEDAWLEIEDIYRNINRKWSNNFSNVIRMLKKLVDIRLIPSAKDIHGPSLSMFFEPGGKNGKWLECNINQENGLLPKLQKIRYNTSMAFLTKCVDYVEQEMHDAGQLTYFDCLYYLRNMLRDDARAEGKLIRYIYDRHSYFLIDEFQDTNPMQAEVFFYLASENPVEKWDECNPRPGSLFIVGDPKQSIYRFRNADVTSFLKVKGLFENGVGAILELSRNFRSKRSLCEYFNSCFTRMLPEETVNQSKFEEIPLPDYVHDEFQGVYSYPSEKGIDSEQVGKLVLRLVNNESLKIRGKGENELRPIRYSDIMIITYGKAALSSIMGVFEDWKIPMKVEGQVLFGMNAALYEIYCIYAAVVDADDLCALYQALAGPLMAVTKEEMILYRSSGGKLSLNTILSDEECDTESAKKVADKLRELSEVRVKSRGMSPAALMSYIMEHLKIFNTVNSKNLEVAYYALELIRSAERSGVVVSHLDGKSYLATLLNGESEIERCLSLNDNENSVHLANLHKVKGLEAPIVILALANSAPTIPSVRIQYNEDSVEGYIFQLDKANKEEGYFFATKQFEQERDAEKGALEAEEVRKVYVAATRARNALIVCSYGMGRSRWKDLLAEPLTDITEEVAENQTPDGLDIKVVDAADLYSQAESESVLNNRECEVESYTLASPSKLSLVSKVSEEQTTDDVVDGDEPDAPKRFASVMGTMTHKMMEELVSSRGKIDCNSVIREIVSEYRTAAMVPYENEITASLETVAKTITSGGYKQNNGLPNDILKTLLNAEEVHCEVPFCYKEEQPEGIVIWNGVIDVIYCSGGQWHIVDYKTNADGDGLDIKYQNQLEAYVKAFKEITGNEADAKTYHIDV